MYNKPDIKETLNILMKKNVPLKEIINAVREFTKDIEDESIIRESFKFPEMDEMGERLGLWEIDESFFFGNAKADADIQIDELFDILNKAINAGHLTEEEKKEFIFAFARNFGECSETEEFCENKVYVIIKNIGKDSNFDDEDEYDIVEKFNNINDAESYVDDIYIGCCDDAYFAEEVWFRLLCDIQSNEWDTLKNFCKIFEVNAKGLEEGRASWEEANLEQDDEGDDWEENED